MFEPAQPSARRNFLDGSYIVLLLSVAIASGYVILSPGSKSAPQAVLVGTVIASAPVATDMVTPTAPAVTIPDSPKSAESSKTADAPKAGESPKAVEAPTPAKIA